MFETLSTPFGAWDRCPSCRGIFIHQDLIASASQDRAKCIEALEETQALLLPTERSCPKCLQKLFDGRVRSRGVIFSLCPTCQSFWTSLPILQQFEEQIEKTLNAQAEIALGANAGASGSSQSEIGARPTSSPAERLNDSILGSFFRVFARLFDRVADRFSKEPREKPAKAEKQKKPAKTTKPAKLIQSVEPIPPAELVQPTHPVQSVEVKPIEPLQEAPKIEIPDFIFPEEPVVEEKPIPEPASVVAEPPPLPEPPPVPGPPPIPEPLPSTPEPVQAPQVAEEPAPLPTSESADEMRRLLLDGPAVLVERDQRSKKETSKPAEKKAPLPTSSRTGFLEKLKASWRPMPKKTIPSSKPVETAKPAPRPVAKPKPTLPAKVAPPVKAVQPAAAPKPKKEKPPTDPFDHIAFWPPWGLSALGVVLSAFRDYGFEGGPAVLWGIMGWSIGMMVRLSRLYPFKSFQTSRLQALLESKEPLGWRGVPVVLNGAIVPAHEEDPKGMAVFKQEERVIPLNRLGRWDMVPRLFGLANPRQLLSGAVTLTGWYHGGLTPWLEIHELRAEKTFRKSMTRTLRWVLAVLLFVIALMIYLSLD